jgi:hypothetical protein
MRVVGRRILGKEFHEQSHAPERLDFVQLSGPDNSRAFLRQHLFVKGIEDAVSKCSLSYMD